MDSHFSRNLNKGFTLIELLIVVAVIGVLAAVILGALNSARGKGADAKIKTQLTSMRSQAELYTGTGTAFAVGTCATTAGTLFETGNGGLGNMFNGLTLANMRCVSTAGQPYSGNVNWAVAAQTVSGAWCVDSTGVGRDRTSGGTLYTTTLTTAIAAAGTSCL